VPPRRRCRSKGRSLLARSAQASASACSRTGDIPVACGEVLVGYSAWCASA
jgi:hypothetical protein